MGNILKIVLFVFVCSAFATAVNIPSPVKEYTCAPWEEVTKLFGGNLKLRESGLKSENSVSTRFGPATTRRIKPFKLITDGIPEFFGSGSKAAPATIEFGKICSNCRHNEGARYLWDMSACELDQVIHDFIFGLKLGLIFWIIIFFSK